ncbi:MAG: HD domain-containing protein [Chloroflexi bacterium]|nr:HD domain-containing protein [Chloroflexota bacterium]
MTGARYRIWQFGRLLTTRMPPEALAEVRAWLTPSLFDLFCRMTPAEQHHAYCVWQTLMKQGYTDRDLLTAALLHDVGKSKMPLAAWEKVAIVLGFKFMPRLAEKWGGTETGKPSWWARPFVVAVQHPAWGADLAEAAGGSASVVSLIRHHQNKSRELAWLPELQAADNAN